MNSTLYNTRPELFFDLFGTGGGISITYLSIHQPELLRNVSFCCEVLPTLSKLTHFDVDVRSLPNGLAHERLCDAIGQTKLQELWVGNIPNNVFAVETYCRAMKRSRYITSFMMTKTAFDASSSVPLIADMIRNSNVNHVGCDFDELTDSGLLQLGMAIRRNKRFESLSIGECPSITRDGIRGFIETIGNHRTFYELDTAEFRRDGMRKELVEWFDSMRHWQEIRRIELMILLIHVAKTKKKNISMDIIRQIDGYL